MKALIFPLPHSTLLLSTPCLFCLLSKESPLFCVMSSWGATVFGRRLCLSYKMKKKKGEEKERRQNKEPENLRPPRALLHHIVRICLTASQEGLHLSLNMRGIITDQNKLPICSQQRCLPVKSPELHKI